MFFSILKSCRRQNILVYGINNIEIKRYSKTEYSKNFSAIGCSITLVKNEDGLGPPVVSVRLVLGVGSKIGCTWGLQSRALAPREKLGKCSSHLILVIEYNNLVLVCIRIRGAFPRGLALLFRTLDCRAPRLVVAAARADRRQNWRSRHRQLTCVAYYLNVCMIAT